MSYPLADQIIARQNQEGLETIGAALKDENLSWEEVSAIASKQNARLLFALENADRLADKIVEAATDQAMDTGARMFEKARSVLGNEYIPELLGGVNSFVLRVRTRMANGGILPMNYMDPITRRAVFLVENALKAPLTQQETELLAREAEPRG